MTASTFRALLVSDTHLGFDEPVRPRSTRRRRGPDFFANYERALHLASELSVDLLIHAGDLLFRSRVRVSLVDRAMTPLRRLADSGLPIVLVPGNHERSNVPFGLLARHPLIHVFDRPRTVSVRAGPHRVAVSGFPYQPNVRDAFRSLVEATGWRDVPSDIRVLVVHQAVEGARVGAHDYVFRTGPDVVPGHALPREFAALIAGHVHRRQFLRVDSRGRTLPCPVIVPGSTERTSMAERAEPKGVVLACFDSDGAGGVLRTARFLPLPTRPMFDLEIVVEPNAMRSLPRRVAAELNALPPESVVRLRVRDPSGHPIDHPTLRPENLRSLVPHTMTVDLAWKSPMPSRRGRAER